MGWRQGKGVGKRSSKSTSGSGSKWGEMSTVGVENVKFYDVPNKDDTYGLGHDPFKVSYFHPSLEHLRVVIIVLTPRSVKGPMM